MTFEAYIQELNNLGWRLGSLCQLGGTEWYACLVDDEGFIHTATGDSPMDAMATAFQRPHSGRVYSRADGVYVDSDGDKLDLVALGLKKPKQPLDDRRF